MHPFDPYVIQKIYEQLQAIRRELNDVIHRLTTLEQEMNDIRSGKQMHIERIEYKFDQLKVERLEGTLNIGLSPQDRDAIEQYVVGENEDWKGEERDQELFHRIQQHIHAYLTGDVFEEIKKMEEEYDYRLDEPYRKFIVEDIKRQIDKRIAAYMDNMDQGGMNNPEKEQLVIEKVRGDIHKAIEEFIKHLPKEGE